MPAARYKNGGGFGLRDSFCRENGSFPAARYKNGPISGLRDIAAPEQLNPFLNFAANRITLLIIAARVQAEG